MMRRLCPRRLGSLVQANALRLSLALSLAMIILCAAINSGKLDVELSSWIQRTTRVETELQTIEAAIGDGSGSNNLLILQIPKPIVKDDTLPSTREERSKTRFELGDERKSTNNVLSVESMMIHLEALAIATHVTIDLYDVSWSLKDICFAPTPPDYEGFLVNQMLDHLMPCVIKTPLDCFWEGAKLLGPEQDVRLSSIGPKLKWTNLNPITMIEMQQRALPHASFPYETLLGWMRRVGINDGYQSKPCLDPSDPSCPITAPNKLSGEAPNVANHLMGGCRGLASKQMHWKEEELIGGVTKNKSGYILGAEALQSTIILMSERDMYEYWRKTSKVQDINNWSAEKAKLVLDIWQTRFREELMQFTRSSMTSNSYKIHALTPKSMLEPINTNTVLDMNNFKLTAALMTLFMCIAFPQIVRKTSHDTSLPGGDKTSKTSQIKKTMIALATSAIVIVTFVASLGLSSFFNLPFNMATTQILPPLALFYGFRQALLITSTFSKHYKHTEAYKLTSECLSELMPIIVIECSTFIIPLIVAASFPVQATRAFTLQAITYILLSTFMSVIFIPSLLIISLNGIRGNEESLEISYNEERPKSRTRNASQSILSITNRKTSKADQRPVEPSIEEQIFSRLQNDLKIIKSESQRATDIKFSARIGPDGLRTSFTLKTDGSQTSSDFDAKERSGLDPDTRYKTSEPNFGLPDLLLSPENLQNDLDTSPQINLCQDTKFGEPEELEDYDAKIDRPTITNRILSTLVKNRVLQLGVVLVKIIMLVSLFLYAPKVKFGLRLRDIIIRGSGDYESFMIREKFFPVYNIFAITKSGLDYPSNQKLMQEFYERLSHVNGIIKDDQDSEHKFWLSYFRDWLLELQESFDLERNRSLISKDGWDEKASDNAKLAYKLLVQTGKLDNPIDKDIVETNRLVDKNGMINQKAFYHYLTAWVMNDAFTYSTSQADFRPEPKLWNENPNDLRIERARPLYYAQIPFLIKLPENQENMDVISEIRAISDRFDLLDLPNFPTGIPFIFWDQFINLDYLFYTAIIMIVVVLFLLFGSASGDFTTSMILVLPTASALLEVYLLLGYYSIPFNSIVGVMIISATGVIAAHSIHIVLHFQSSDGDVPSRVCDSFRQSFPTVIISLILLGIMTLVFNNSKIDFMTEYSYLLFYLLLASSFNSSLLTPVLLALLGAEHPVRDEDQDDENATSKSPIRSPIRSPKFLKSRLTARRLSSKYHHKGSKRRGFPRVQSEISLSTISEEPQSESRVHDLKLNFSIRC